MKEVSLATPLPSSWASPSSSPSSSWSSWSLPTSFIPKALWSSSSKIVANAAAEENGRMEEEFRRQMLEYELYNEKRTTEVEQEAKRKSDETVQRTNSTSGNFTSFADNITTTDNGENGTSSVASPPPPLTETRTMMKTEQEKKLEQRQEEKKDSLQVAKFNSTSLENDVGGDHDNTSIINDGANTISLLGEMYNKKE